MLLRPRDAAVLVVPDHQRRSRCPLKRPKLSDTRRTVGVIVRSLTEFLDLTRTQAHRSDVRLVSHIRDAVQVNANALEAFGPIPPATFVDLGGQLDEALRSLRTHRYVGRLVGASMLFGYVVGDLESFATTPAARGAR